ncbi:MAG: MaoC family dehydratase N-terminal domain-containing protein, partial [Chloroflexota bacterium]
MTTEQQKDAGWTKIDDNMLAKMRSTIGREARYKNPWHTAVTLDNLKHFAFGIGDPNPLWWRLDYARNTRYGTCIASPTFLYSANCGPSWYPDDPGSKGQGLPGIHGLWGGDTWEWRRPLKLGEPVVAITKLLDVTERPRSSYSTRVILENKETRFEADKGEVVAKYVSHLFRFERGAPKEKK